MSEKILNRFEERLDGWDIVIEVVEMTDTGTKAALWSDDVPEGEWARMKLDKVRKIRSMLKQVEEALQ